MRECRFDGPGPGCAIHDSKGPALCTHAAAELERRVADLQLALEPGKASGIVAGLFKEAIRLGRSSVSSEPPILWLTGEIEGLRTRLTRLEEDKRSIEDAWAICEERVVRLEEEKVRREQMLLEGASLVREGSGLLETTQHRLTQAEAREVAMREANKLVADDMEFWLHHPDAMSPINAVTEWIKELRDALAKRGEEGKP